MNRAEVAESVRALLRSRAAGEVADNAVLGAEGLGLDSIAIAEVLLECEERFGLDASDILGEQLTVRGLIERAARAAS